MLNQPQLTPSTTHFNVMELLVADEVDRQLQDLPPRLTKYLKRGEIETFALNRLPALYAASERGLEYQRAKAQTDLHPQITQAVRQALAAVQGDPLRTAQPLQIDAPQPHAEAALALLQQWLEAPDLTWDKALTVLAQQQRQQTFHAQGVAQAMASVAPPPPVRRAVSEDYAKDCSELKSTALRPGVYGCRTTWIPKQHQAQSWQR